MIKGLYETHLFVENLEISIDFYKNVLKLEQCYYEEGRRAAFFWIGKPKEAMLGLWEKPKSEIEKRHFAFRCDKEFILNQATELPAIAIYFNDPDGHYLEFIAILNGEARPELGVISYDEWINYKT